MAISSPSLGVGPASAFSETLIAVAPRPARSATVATASSGPVSSRPVPAGAQPAFVGYPPCPVSIAPAARINGPWYDGISEASASGKMRSGGHARSRTAVTPFRSTATGSESSMCTWRSATAGIRNPSTTSSSSASPIDVAGPAYVIRPPSQTTCASSTIRPGPSHANGARTLSRVMAPL